MIIRKPRLLVFFFCLLFVGCLLFHKEIGRVLFSFQYREIIEEHTKTTKLDPRLVAALIYVESGFNPRAVSKKGARGLMQLMPETAEWIAKQRGESFDLDSLFIPLVNLDLGIWYLNYLHQVFQGNTVTMLASYNAGWARVRVWVEEEVWQGRIGDLRNIPYPETRRYVARVLRVYQIYKYIYPAV
ncbi:MAG TPA: lytic transglycosylase domain-containing protein [Bacillota bacterium]